MVDEELKRQVIQDVVLLKLTGFKPIIVHGGGKEISRWVGKVGMEPHFVNGLRVTDEDTMEIAEMVLNKVNKSLVQLVNELGVNAVGISGKDGTMLKCKKKYSCGEDIGFVGEVEEENPFPEDHKAPWDPRCRSHPHNRYLPRPDISSYTAKALHPCR